MSDWQKLQAYLTLGQEVTLLVHEKPDGDCLGSALGLGMFLQAQGYVPWLYLPSPLPELFNFLPGQEMIKVVAQGFVPENTPVIAVDCGDLQRWDYTIPVSSPLLNIDHHVSNTMFGLVNVVDTTAAATGEILYQVMREAGWVITSAVATCLYVAISTDTGSFRYSNVTPETFRIAGELVKAGADLDLIRNELFERRPLAELVTMGLALKSLTFSAERKIASVQLDYALLSKEKLLDADTDGIIGMIRATDGVELALIFKEPEPGKVKVSLRSKSYVDVNQLAQHFQGGGHPRAAGCTISGEFADIYTRVMSEACRAVAKECKNERGN